MKSAFSTIGCYNWSFGEIFATAKDFGYEGFEVRAISNEIYAPKIKAFLPENRESTKARLKDANLSIPVLTSFIFLGDANATENQMLRAKEYIDVAAAMEVPYIRILADDTAAPDNEVNEELLVHNLKTLCEYAQKNNVTVLVETNGIYADSSRI